MSDKAQAEQIESALTPTADMKGDIGFCRLGPHPDLCSAAQILMTFQRQLCCVGEIGGHRFLRSVDNPWVADREG